jgi:hypothetical protein
MSLILSGTDGLSDVDGSAATPAIRGADANTGIFFPAADTIAFSEGGVESMRVDSSGNLILGATSGGGLNERLSVTGNGILVQSAASTNRGLFGNFGGSNLISGSFDSIPLEIRTNNIARFLVGTAGQLGIGGATYGTAGQVLTSGGSGAAPTWSTPSAGALVFISSQTASGAPTTIDFTSGFGTTYDNYVMMYENVLSSVDNTELAIRLYKDGSFQTAGYTYQYSDSRAGTTITTNGSISSDRIQFNTGNTTGNATYQSGQIQIFNVNSNATYAGQIQGQIMGSGGANTGKNYTAFGSGAQSTTAFVRGIRFYWGSGGTFTSGTFRLYGIAKS